MPEQPIPEHARVIIEHVSGRSGYRLAAHAASAIVLLSVLVAGVPTYAKVVRLAASLMPLSMQERRVALFGAPYQAAISMRRTLHPGATIDIVMMTPEARDVAILTGSELHGYDCQFFEGVDAWQLRKRAAFFRDARAANAVPGPPPTRASVVLTVAPGADASLRVLRAQ